MIVKAGKEGLPWRRCDFEVSWETQSRKWVAHEVRLMKLLGIRMQSSGARKQRAYQE